MLKKLRNTLKHVRCRAFFSIQPQTAEHYQRDVQILLESDSYYIVNSRCLGEFDIQSAGNGEAMSGSLKIQYFTEHNQKENPEWKEPIK